MEDGQNSRKSFLTRNEFVPFLSTVENPNKSNCRIMSKFQTNHTLFYGCVFLGFSTVDKNFQTNTKWPPSWIFRQIKNLMNFFFLSSEPVDQLRNELDQVTNERDQLVSQVKADADQLEAFVASVHLQGMSRCRGLVIDTSIMPKPQYF